MKFFLESLVFTIFSPDFYKSALGKGGKRALGNFLIFIALVSTIASIFFLVRTKRNFSNLPKEFEDVAFESLEIREGKLNVEGIEMPFEYKDAGTYFGLDTTGKLTEIPEGYAEGLLVTEYYTTLRSKEYYGDQTFSYAEIFAEIDENEFRFTKKDFVEFLQGLNVLLMIIGPIFIFIFKFIAGFISVFAATLIGTVVFSIKNVQDPFKKSWIIALYAYIPVFYVSFLYGLFNDYVFNFAVICCLVPLGFWIIKWIVFWGIGYVGFNLQDNSKLEV